MLKGALVTLRPMIRADCENVLNWGHNIELQLLGGGERPMPNAKDFAP